MELQHIFALPSEPSFDAGNPFGFENDWFPGILELKYDLAVIDYQALALAGRLTARSIAADCDSSGEYGAKVLALYFDGVAFGLTGSGGENGETDFLFVTDRPLYEAANQHAREFLDLSRCHQDVTYVDPGHYVSLHEIFGHHFDRMAETALQKCRETFGDDADALLGYDALPLLDGVTGLMMARSDTATPVAIARTRHMLLSHKAEAPPAVLFKGGRFYARQGLLEDDTSKFMLKSLPEYRSAWLYHLCEAKPANDSDIARVA
jgi:hypothetical protein